MNALGKALGVAQDGRMFGNAPPPHYCSSGFLAPQDQQALLDWALANRDSFEPGRIVGGVVEPSKRRSETLQNLGPMKAVLKRRFTEELPRMVAAMGVAPFRLDRIELELAAHGDGAHFAAHMDTLTSEARRKEREAGRFQNDRIISAVYYLHREPKGFAGGALRLHPFDSTGSQDGYVDIEPLQNSVVAFPSWVFHEVRPVECPSGAFEDYRFAVNCWFRTDLERKDELA